MQRTSFNNIYKKLHKAIIRKTWNGNWFKKIGGTLDDAVPYNDALDLEKLISNCGLVTYEGNTHYAYLERLAQTNNVLKSFIGGDK